MPDEFILLTDCGDTLPAAKVVDRIPFYRFASLNITSADDGKTHQAIFPQDHAVPELVKKYAIDGWPPEDIVDARGGRPLILEMEEAPAESRTNPASRVTVDDLDKFLANSSAYIDDVQLDYAHVEALLSTGQTVIRPDDAPPILVQANPSAATSNLVADGTTIVADIASLVDSNQHLVPISTTNVRELRERGSTWVRLPSSRGGGAVRVVSASHTAVAPNGTPSARSAATAGLAEAGIQRSIAYSYPSVLGNGTLMSQEAWEQLVGIGRLSEEVSTYMPRLPSFRFVLYLAYAQEWELVGYARGELLNTITLAPQEETTIEIFTWDRSKVASDDTTESGWESSLEAGFTGKFSWDIVNETTKNEAWKLTSAGVNVSVPEYATVGANLGGDFGDTLTTVNKDTISLVSESTVKAAYKARGMRQTKVSESREWGSESRNTRKLENPNMGMSVSYHYFEILASYKVRTRAVPEQTRLAVLVPSPLPIKSFDRPMVLAFEGALRRVLLDEVQRSGFDSMRWLAAREEFRALQKAKEIAEPTQLNVSYGKGITVSAGVENTVSPQDGTSQQTTAVPAGPVLDAGDRVVVCIRAILSANKRAVKIAWDAGKRGDGLKPAEIKFRQWMLRKFGFEKFQPGFWQACTRFEQDWRNDRSVERLDQLLKETSSAWLESVGNVALMVGLWPLFIIRCADLVATLAVELGPGEAATHVLNGHVGFDDAGLGAELDGAREAMKSHGRALAAAQAPVLPIAPDALQPAQPGTGAPTDPVQVGQPREPFPDEQTAAHVVAQNSLLAHLEANRSHYLEAIWASFQPTDRARLLGAVFGKLGGEVEPELLGFYEDEVAVPFRVDRYPEVAKRLEKAMAEVQSSLPEDERDVVLPTAGLHVETRLGECDALEPFIVNHREYDLTEKEAQVQRAGLENERLKARLEAKLLEDPDTDGTGLTVRLVDNKETHPG